MAAMDTTPSPIPEPSTDAEGDPVESLLDALEGADSADAPDLADEVANRLSAILDETEIEPMTTEEELS